MLIPEQHKEQRFCKINHKSKRPYELAWNMLSWEWTQQEDKTWKNNLNGNIRMITIKEEDGKKKSIPYTGEITNYSYTEMCAWLKIAKENYGVITGVNGLAVIDDDSKEKILMKLYGENFSNTLRIRDHLHIKLLNWDGNKIVFNHPTELNEKTGLPLHLGELQANGVQVVGCNSTHPSGAIYDLRNDIPIIEIEFEDFINVFQIYIKKSKPKEIREYKVTSFSGDDIKDIPISNVISLGSLNNMGGGCFQGVHPKHGSDISQMNFSVNTNNNTWICWRCSYCDAGKEKREHGVGSTSELIAVMEGIISCEDAGPSCFTAEQGREVIKVAREKYGLKTPEENLEHLEPMGLALLFNIKEVAKKRNMERCPDCLELFEFEERLGWFRCSCHGWLGIKKLISMSLARGTLQ